MKIHIFTIDEYYTSKAGLAKIYNAVEGIVSNRDQFFLDEANELRSDYALYVTGTDAALSDFCINLNKDFYDYKMEFDTDLEDFRDYFNVSNMEEFEDVLKANGFKDGKLMPISVSDKQQILKMAVKKSGSQTALAKNLEIGRSAMSQIIKGDRSARIHAIALAKLVTTDRSLQNEYIRILSEEEIEK